MASAPWRSVRLEEFATASPRRSVLAQAHGRDPRVPANQALHGLQESTWPVGHSSEERGGSGILSSPWVEIAVWVSEKACCPKGVKDMVDNPVRHSLVQRSGEIQRVSTAPEQIRAQRFLEETLRPATDAAVFSESLAFDDVEHLAKRMSENRKGLERLRVGLGTFVREGRVISFSQIPLRRAMRG